jgi:hypothetical protein
VNCSTQIADDPLEEHLSAAEKLGPSSTPRSYIFYIRVLPWNEGDRRGRDRMVVGFITTYAISACHHKSCEFESNSGEVYSMQHNVIMFVSDLRQVGGFLRLLRFPPSIKLTAKI